MTSTTASTINEEDRAPGSMWPMLRSPRNDARPRIARIGTVCSAATFAAALRRCGKPAPPSRRTASTGNSPVEHGLLPDIGLAPSLHRVDRIRERIGKLFPRNLVLERLAERHEQRSVKGAGAPPTFMTSVVPTPLSDSPRFLAESSSTADSTASNPRRILAPWSPSPIAQSRSVNSSALAMTRCATALNRSLRFRSRSSCAPSVVHRH